MTLKNSTGLQKRLQAFSFLFTSKKPRKKQTCKQQANKQAKQVNTSYQMEAAIHRYLVVQLFFIFLACNACNEVQLQPTTCLFTKNELFHGYFLRIHVFVFSTFL